MKRLINCLHTSFIYFLVCKKTYDRPFVATSLKFAPNFDHVFLVGGTDAVHLWKLNEETRKATNSIIPLGKIKRTISDMVVSSLGCNGILYRGWGEIGILLLRRSHFWFQFPNNFSDESMKDLSWTRLEFFENREINWWKHCWFMILSLLDSRVQKTHIRTARFTSLNENSATGAFT